MRHSPVSLASGLSCIAVLLAACGGSSDDSGVPLEELPTRLAEAACQVADECFNGNFELLTGTSDCQARLEKEIADGEFGLVQRAIDAGTIDYHASAVEGCILSVEALGCELFVRRLSTTCDEVLVGSVEPGESCSINAECQPGSFCKSDASCPGTCTRLLAAGQTCSDDSDCEDGLVCADDTERCVEPAVVGELCGGGTEPPCLPNLYCKGQSPETPGTCASFEDVFTVGQGAACDLDSGQLCQNDSRCAVVGATLTGGVETECRPPAPSSGTCYVAYPEMCPEGQFCEIDALPFEGTCRASPRDGEPCGVRSLAEGPTTCAPDHVCIDAMCRAIQRLGGACDGDSACYSGVCADGGCAPALCADSG